MINKGDFLISTPESLGDYYFNRSIVILTEVNEDEIVGFMINKELDYTLNDLENMIPFEREIYVTLLSEHVKEENERIKSQQKSTR